MDSMLIVGIPRCQHKKKGASYDLFVCRASVAVNHCNSSKMGAFLEIKKKKKATGGSLMLWSSVPCIHCLCCQGPGLL